MTLIPYVGDDTWIESVLHDIKKTLDGGMPDASKECDHCRYRASADVVERKAVDGLSAKSESEPPPVARRKDTKTKRGSIETQEGLF